MKYVAKAIQLYCALVESEALVTPATVWDWAAVREALAHDPQMVADLEAMSEGDRERVLRYTGSFEPLESLGAVYQFKTPEDARGFMRSMDLAGWMAEAYTETIVHAQGDDVDAMQSEAASYGGVPYAGPKIQDSVSWMDGSLPWDLYAEGVEPQSIREALTNAMHKQVGVLTEGAPVAVDEALAPFAGRLSGWLQPADLFGVPGYVVEALRIGGYLSDSMYRGLLEQQPGQAEDPLAQKTQQTDRGQATEVQPDEQSGGEVAASQSAPAQEPEKPTEHRPAEEQGAPTGDVTLPDGTVVPEEVLKQAFVTFLDRLQTQLQQGTATGQPTPRGADQQQPEEETPAPPQQQEQNPVQQAQQAPQNNPAPTQPNQPGQPKQESVNEAGGPLGGGVKAAAKEAGKHAAASMAKAAGEKMSGDKEKKDEATVTERVGRLIFVFPNRDAAMRFYEWANPEQPGGRWSIYTDGVQHYGSPGSSKWATTLLVTPKPGMADDIIKVAMRHGGELTLREAVTVSEAADDATFYRTIEDVRRWTRRMSGADHYNRMLNHLVFLWQYHGGAPSAVGKIREWNDIVDELRGAFQVEGNPTTKVDALRYSNWTESVVTEGMMGSLRILANDHGGADVGYGVYVFEDEDAAEAFYRDAAMEYPRVAFNITDRNSRHRGKWVVHTESVNEGFDRMGIVTEMDAKEIIEAIWFLGGKVRKPGPTFEQIRAEVGWPREDFAKAMRRLQDMGYIDNPHGKYSLYAGALELIGRDAWESKGMPVTFPRGFRREVSDGAVGHVTATRGSRLVVEVDGQEVQCDPKHVVALADAYDTDRALQDMRAGVDVVKVARSRLHANVGKRVTVSEARSFIAMMDTSRGSASTEEYPIRTAPAYRGEAMGDTDGGGDNPGDRPDTSSDQEKDAGAHERSTLKGDDKEPMGESVRMVARSVADVRKRVSEWIKQAADELDTAADRLMANSADINWGGKAERGAIRMKKMADEARKLAMLSDLRSVSAKLTEPVEYDTYEDFRVRGNTADAYTKNAGRITNAAASALRRLAFAIERTDKAEAEKVFKVTGAVQRFSSSIPSDWVGLYASEMRVGAKLCEALLALHEVALVPWRTKLPSSIKGFIEILSGNIGRLELSLDRLAGHMANYNRGAGPGTPRDIRGGWADVINRLSAVEDAAQRAQRDAKSWLNATLESRGVNEQLDVGDADEAQAAAQGFADAADRLKELRKAAFGLTTDDLVRLSSLLQAIGQAPAAKKVEALRQGLAGMSDQIQKTAAELEKAHMQAGVGDAGALQKPPEGEPMPADAAPMPEPPAEAPAAPEAPPAPEPNGNGEMPPAENGNGAAPPAPAPGQPQESLMSPPSRITTEAVGEFRKAIWKAKRTPYQEGQVVWALPPASANEREVWVAEDPHTRRGVYADVSMIEFLERRAADVLEMAVFRVMETGIPDLIEDGADYSLVAGAILGECADLGLTPEQVAETHTIASHRVSGARTVSFSSAEHALMAGTHQPTTALLADGLVDGGARRVPAAVLAEASRVLKRTGDADRWMLGHRIGGLVEMRRTFADLRSEIIDRGPYARQGTKDLLLARARMEAEGTRAAIDAFNDLWGDTGSQAHDEYWRIAQEMGLEK